VIEIPIRPKTNDERTVIIKPAIQPRTIVMMVFNQSRSRASFTASNHATIPKTAATRVTGANTQDNAVETVAKIPMKPIILQIYAKPKTRTISLKSTLALNTVFPTQLIINAEIAKPRIAKNALTTAAIIQEINPSV